MYIAPFVRSSLKKGLNFNTAEDLFSFNLLPEIVIFARIFI
ncbi:hypothetical protein ERO13_D12G227200v2 [Gossypium hirsutum]|uniref:Uncharacterized protein n=3 Tax=Gossypium TaxID=3633 RepID=A0A5J5P290_GOSBA|nr:hypothetical protein ES319_D12G251700v1 [Gossypium barbadense]KAG4117383.1 hypothetical protein ERO13_D12G227200v2 [Gossypium hirsutum]TYG42548.1 hypothetical protein ES288_D12G265700v1 [Gossypium darwinii]TYH40719.1 hypothetical protein ES332_D12G266900v1 [Gossypium tomentosum]